jgi:hypothetical protein
MKRSPLTASTLMFALSVSAYGCSPDGDKAPPSRDEADDVSATTASLVSSDGGEGGEVRAMNDAVALVRGQAPSGMARSAEGSFVLERAGLRYSYQVACSDAAGADVACGPDADGGTITVDWDGTYDGVVVDGSARRAGTWTLRGARGDQPVFAGEGSFDLSIDYRSLDGRRQSSYDFGLRAAYDEVRFDRALARPVGGQIRYEVEAKRTASGPRRDADAEFEATAVVSFSAAGASLNVGGSYDYDLDLKTGQATATNDAGEGD